MTAISRPGPGLDGPEPPVAVEAANAVSVREVSRAFGEGSAAVLALDRVSLDVRPGELVCLVGASGCGKTTLLNLGGGLATPSSCPVPLPGASSCGPGPPCGPSWWRSAWPWCGRSSHGRAGGRTTCCRGPCRCSRSSATSWRRQFSETDTFIALMIVVLVIGSLADSVFSAAHRSIRRRWGLIGSGT